MAPTLPNLIPRNAHEPINTIVYESVWYFAIGKKHTDNMAPAKLIWKYYRRALSYQSAAIHIKPITTWSPAASNQQPAVKNLDGCISDAQQPITTWSPAASNQQPAINSQQPAINSQQSARRADATHRRDAQTRRADAARRRDVQTRREDATRRRDAQTRRTDATQNAISARLKGNSNKTKMLFCFKKQQQQHIVLER